MTSARLSQRQLGRTLLARQLLVERSGLPIADALSQVGGLQMQYAPAGYVGLWTRLDGFRRASLTRALEERSVVQATLMRGTIHLVAAREYWLFALGVRRARREWSMRGPAGAGDVADAERHAERLRDALRDGPRSVAELGGLASGFVGNVGLWVDLVRVPPSGTWERRRADLLALAEDWVGPCTVTEEEGLAHLVRAYLRGFGPAPWRDISSWAGVPVRPLREAAEQMELVRLADEAGRELVDLPGEAVADGATRPPIRFLAHWDASLLVHARRTGILPEAYRPRIFTSRNPFSVGTYLVDGEVAGAWTVRDGRVHLEPYTELPAPTRQEVEAEAARLDAFHGDEGA